MLLVRRRTVFCAPVYQSEAHDASAREGQMATILIVDDDALSRQFLQALLGYGGHHLLEAADGHQALNLAHAAKPELIITDILMPNMDGYEFVSRLHADTDVQDIPVIFYTATYREREANVMAMACDVHWVLAKPSDPDLILNKVHEALGVPRLAKPPPQMRPPPPEATRFSGIDNKVNEYLFELESSTHLIEQFAGSNDPNLLKMSQRLAKSLSSLQAVSLRLTALIDLGIQLAVERDDVGMLEVGCRVAQNICVAKYAAVGVLDAQGDRLQCFVTRGLDSLSRELLGTPSPRRGVLGTLLEKRLPQRVNGLGGVPLSLGLGDNHPPVHSFLGVPIMSRDKNYGWLYLADKLGADEFSEVDERVAMTVSAELAVAYENLILLEEIKRNHVRLQAEMEARSRSDNALRRFRTAMDASTDAIFLLDRAVMRLIDVNDAASRILGYTREEFLKLGAGSECEKADSHFFHLYDQVIAYQGPGGTSEIELRRKDGSVFPVEIVRRMVPSQENTIMVAVARDITERKEAEERLLHLAHYDPLTGLPNRLLFFTTLSHTLKQAADHEWKVAVLFIDLDRFKNVNDTLGHHIGDELLRQFAQRVLSCIRVRDTLGRMGGDEFALMLTLAEGEQSAALVALKILDVLRQPFSLLGHEATVAASIGVTIFPDDAADPETLLKFADTAMYRAKESGRDTYRFFTQEMNLHAQARLEMENALHRALDNHEFMLHYQPQVSLASGKIVGAEALLRWRRPDKGLVSPAEFIPILEDTGLIMRVGGWVIDTACRQIRDWKRQFTEPISIAVNVSGKQFVDAHLELDVLQALEIYQIPPALLEIELTESSMMSNAAQSAVLLERLSHLGVKISIDDFGTGYSSLAYLKRFPIDKLKVDIAFIRDVTTNPEDAAITRAIIHMAHSLKLAVVAEGVETAGQLEFLRDHHCDAMQGYYFSRPVPADEFEQMLRDEKSLFQLSEK